jgi:outer membrane protein assembly factor BamB
VPEFATASALIAASKDLVVVYSAKDGAQLWSQAAKAPGGRGGRIAIPWKNGVAIGGKLHDLSTGEPIGVAPQALNGNCTPPLVTANLVVQAMSFTSGTEPGNGPRSLGLRLQCQEGGMVANGMLYSGPAMCACAAGGRMEGFTAFGTAGVRVADADFTAPRPVIKGPGRDRPFASMTEDWPMYRHDACRSNGANVPAPRQMKTRWEKRLAALPTGPVSASWVSQVAAGLTAPTIAGGLVYVADSETHRVLALSAVDGQVKWVFRADARVDGPPTIHQGRCLFGCRDGWVYCLRADDGQLVWRSRAAPW